MILFRLVVLAAFAFGCVWLWDHLAGMLAPLQEALGG